MVSPKTTSILSRLPSFYRSGDETNVLYQLMETYAAILEGAEDDLIRVMRSHWVDKADNEGLEGLDTQQKGDLDKIFALWLESLGGTALLRQSGRREGAEGLEDDVAYRERIKALIKVIQRGASTIEGIRAVVAANLGIIGDDPLAVYARRQIRIEEYLPEATKTAIPNLALYSPFILQNPNPVHTPVGFQIQVKGDIPLPIVDLFVELPATQQTLGCPVNLVKGDELYLFFDKTALLNGEPLQTFGTGIQLPPGSGGTPSISRLQFGAKLGYPMAQFDQTRYDQAAFNVGLAAPIGRFDAPGGFDHVTFALADPVLSVTVLTYHIYPGAFTVAVPWDSPGFTTTFSLSNAAKAVLEKFGTDPTDLEGLENKVYDTLNALQSEPWMLKLAEAGQLYPVLEAIAPLLLAGEDRFRQMPVDPRAQIRPIIERVRAAGIYTLVRYEKRFTETHLLSDGIRLAGSHTPFTEDIGINTKWHDALSVQTLQKTDPEKHEMTDKLILSGLFDLTHFDSLNGWA